MAATISGIKTVTATAPVNIAVIKYWGKRDEKLILPLNGSISVTLDQAHLRAKTTVAASSKFDKDRFWLNSCEKSIDEDERLQSVLKEIRRRARKRQHSKDGSHISSILNWKVHICSENNFPTAAGLASSAAGFACLVFALAKLYNVTGNISDIARQGSGSACRSIYGGFVEWVVGSSNDGSDSIAQQIVPEDHWSDFSILVLVVSAEKKHTSSTAGMQTSVETSPLLRYRADHLVPRSLTEMTSAIKEKDFDKFAELTMRDSNQMHAICLDTFPPFTYLTAVSHDIIRLVTSINKFYGKNVVAYTFDAGPNACLLLLKEDVPRVLALINFFFPQTENGNEFVRGISVEVPPPDENLVSFVPLTPCTGAIKYVIHSKIGRGPTFLDNPSMSLLDDLGFPLSVQLGEAV